MFCKAAVIHKYRVFNQDRDYSGMIWRVSERQHCSDKTHLHKCNSMKRQMSVYILIIHYLCIIKCKKIRPKYQGSKYHRSLYFFWKSGGFRSLGRVYNLQLKSCTFCSAHSSVFIPHIFGTSLNR